MSKIQSKDQFGLMFLASYNIGGFREKFVKSMMADLGPDVERNGDLKPVDRIVYWLKRQSYVDAIMNDKAFKHYLITDKVVEMASTIPIGTKFDYKLLDKIESKSCCYLLGPNEFFRFVVEQGKQIQLLWFKYNPQTSMVNHKTFTIDYLKGISAPDDMIEEERQIAKWLLQMIIFVEISDPELLFIASGGKSRSTQKQILPIHNTSPVSVTRVTSTWNKFVIRTDAVNVKGFLRLQACGPQWSERKLVWVTAHERGGFVRKGGGVKTNLK